MKSKKKENCDALPRYYHRAITDFLFLILFFENGEEGVVSTFLKKEI